MKSTSEYFKELFQDDSYDNLDKLSMIYKTKKGLSVILAVSKLNNQRMVYFCSNESDCRNMPHFYGLGIDCVSLNEFDSEKKYCEIKQEKGSEEYIFEVIVDDILKNINELNKESEISNAVSKVLFKWKKFFALKREIVMSSIAQQGLYGELLTLKLLVENFGQTVINDWTGPNNETHDFYYNGNGIEVKTTHLKEPYQIHINSEYQLDDTEIKRNLFLKFYAFRKSESESDGTSLPELVDSVRNLFNNNIFLKNKFEQSLEQYGYFEAVRYLYTDKYFVRESLNFWVRDDFPRIVKKELQIGLSGCMYDVSISNCGQYQITDDTFLKALKTGIVTDE